MINNKILLAGCCFMLSLIPAVAQRAVASGGNASGSGGTLSWTIGLTDYIHPSGISEGMQQPYEITVSGLETFAYEPQLTVYPNPASEHVILEMNDAVISGVSYYLYDMRGMLVSSQAVNTSRTQIDLNNQSAGMYMLRIVQHGIDIKSFRILKNK